MGSAIQNVNLRERKSSQSLEKIQDDYKDQLKIKKKCLQEDIDVHKKHLAERIRRQKINSERKKKRRIQPERSKSQIGEASANDIKIGSRVVVNKAHKGIVRFLGELDHLSLSGMKDVGVELDTPEG